jgi:hypothetical protein
MNFETAVSKIVILIGAAVPKNTRIHAAVLNFLCSCPFVMAASINQFFNYLLWDGRLKVDWDGHPELSLFLAKKKTPPPQEGYSTQGIDGTPPLHKPTTQEGSSNQIQVVHMFHGQAQPEQKEHRRKCFIAIIPRMDTWIKKKTAICEKDIFQACRAASEENVCK